MNFLDYKFRCSSLPGLMSNGRGKGTMGKTAEAVIRDAWIKETFGREKNITTPAMRKGTMVESDTLELVKTVTGLTYFKNNTELSNDFIKGTPDVKSAPDRIIDIKSSFDLWTFAAVDQKTAEADYFWQLAGYAFLEGKNKIEIIYGLVNTPDEIMIDLWWPLDKHMKDGEAENIVRHNHTYDDIPAEKRLKRFEFDVLPEHIEQIKERVNLAREYMQSLSL